MISRIFKGFKNMALGEYFMRVKLGLRGKVQFKEWKEI